MTEKQRIWQLIEKYLTQYNDYDRLRKIADQIAKEAKSTKQLVLQGITAHHQWSFREVM